MSILETINLSKTYGSKESKVNALDNININIEKGEFVAIIGPSGSGKSTLLHLLGGLERLNGGSIKVNEKDISKLKDKELAEYRRKEVGFVFQQYNLIPVLNVEENIELPLMLGNDDIDEIYISELIDILGLKERKKHLPSQLSGGQQQRVAIGRALSTKPSIILADEPTGNLDSKTTEEVMELLKKSIKKYNQTLIVITHDQNIAKKADRIINIVDGHIKI
ncbi:ABC transporter ATP-binding protein,Lipoprotein-releasing system ATP-binding protein LolD,macrolide transporter ATP-binding /permease protein,Predicted ABC-type transport system involved in lysophospholipase L1 biosynthesis, ATPase component,lipoprotein releasing system, ATP-binding protein,ABC transporter [[Clostridium] sordellii]|uniref:ABC transporter ATP-binding protein n=1 Tax=Paraclostridium sordellii TaxID=1505 RepID=UPI0005421EAD|nr:ABC transporter ATP-binding protein [Paeniclostridium sordellii]CEK34783.1 ABC transporter ATP-binding protein,Lipoprotein-releasing system ATP-binding protein LolD,macrolide transporter ATP-binding /permease protein,Predicted ABC-type transport system involved in lysophospholipase L1 biosynthesis, ATPase component,lipoprotein releasing system, ATP-binding protein,ABC transporter [[Clostridium] sordellii] [Paeniclostridium sordellii]